MKKWPKGDGQIPAEEALARLRAALDRVQAGKPPRYAGWPLVKPVAHVALQPDEALTRQDDGLDATGRALCLAFQLGVCQGYRIRGEQQQMLLDVVKGLLAEMGAKP